MSEIVKFVKATLFGRKKNKKQKNTPEPALIKTARRSTVGRMAYELEDLKDDMETHRKASCYHSGRTRKYRKPIKSVALGENLDVPASDSDEEMFMESRISRQPRKVTFTGREQRERLHSVDRMSYRSRRRDSFDDVENLRARVMKLETMITSSQNNMSDRYLKLRDRYDVVKQQNKRLQQQMRQSQMARLMPPAVLPVYPAAPPYFVPTPAYSGPQTPAPPPPTMPAPVFPGLTPPSLGNPFRAVENRASLVPDCDLDSTKDFRRAESGAPEGYATERSLSAVSFEDLAELPREEADQAMLTEESAQPVAAVRDDGYQTCE